MYIILGGTGHVGSAVANELLRQYERVTIITRSPEKATAWEKKGARTVIADIKDTERLHQLFKKGKYLFLLNPPAPPDTDTDQQERLSIRSVLEALVNTSIQKIVAASTYGAQPGENIGDLGTLYDMEQGLKDLHIPYTVLRAAYYMSNWKTAIDAVTKEHKLYTFFPPDHRLPMAAPEDIGKAAADLLVNEIESSGIQYVEGPKHYSANDVADAFSNALRKKIETVTIPRERWIETMRSAGFSEKAATSFAGMTALAQKEDLENPVSPIKGDTTLDDYIMRLVNKT